MGFIPSEPYPLAEPCTFRLPYPHAVSDIACSCSEDQEATMPRNSRALLPAKIRTRLEPIARAGRYSHGILYSSAAAPQTASTSGPAPASSTPWIAKPEGFPFRRPRPRQQEEDRIPWVRPSFRRAFTRTCPRVLPATAVSCQIAPTSSELALLTSSNRLAWPGRSGTRRNPGGGLLRASLRRSHAAGRPPRQPFSSHRFVKENL